MDLWIVVALYVVGLGMVVAETMLPGVTMGLIGLGLLVLAVLIAGLMFRGHRGPKRPSLISRSMGRRIR